MPVYRIYLVHEDGRLEPDESFYETEDAHAVNHLAPPDRSDVRAELWQGGRLVGVAGTWRGASPTDFAAGQVG